MKSVKRKSLRVKRMGIDTYKEAVIYLREDNYICRAEGFEAQTRIRVGIDHKFIIATLNIVDKSLLKKNEVGLSEYAWTLLNPEPKSKVYLSHPKPLQSLKYIHDKIYNRKLTAEGINEIVNDIVAGRLSDIHLSSFLTACAGGRLDQNEVIQLTKSMIYAGDSMVWPANIVVDKHCVGGLPGNRTTLIVVPIVSAFGLLIPKTSSRAITSAAGTLDAMEVLAPVELPVEQMRKVVETEGGCIVWGGALSLSPADDVLIRVEHALDLNSEGQMVASVLSKKIAAGSNHIVIDAPVGPLAKVRNNHEAKLLQSHMEAVGKALGVHVRVIETDGTQPIGYGVGPALEAQDALAVLQNHSEAPPDLRGRALMLAGILLEFSPHVEAGKGIEIAEEILESGKAWQKFQAICDAQGGMREIPTALFSYIAEAKKKGIVTFIDNYKVTKIAKLAGAPEAKAAGLKLHVKLNSPVEVGQPLFTIYSNAKGELEYALSLLAQDDIIKISETV